MFWTSRGEQGLPGGAADEECIVSLDRLDDREGVYVSLD